MAAVAASVAESIDATVSEASEILPRTGFYM